MSIDITGIDRAALLAALYNGTKAVGLGILHDIRRDMTREEAEAVFHDAERFSEPGSIHFDYLCGRPLKVTFKENVLEGARLYDRDSEPGACARIVEQVRKAQEG